MLRHTTMFGALAIALGALCTTTLADETAKKDGCCEQQDHSASLGKLKDLVGEWASADQDGDGKADVTVSYRLTAAGSALVETLMPGTPNEMVTVYHRDGDAWVATHYCAMGNQPRMRGAPVAGSKAAFEVAFTFADATNVKPGQGRMNGLRLTLADATHLRHDWTFTAPAGEKKTVTFELTKRA